VDAKLRDPFDVLDWILSRQVHEYVDAAGRPVGEGRSAAFQDIETEMRSCPYSGSRYRHAKPMNATALQQMPPWPHILTMLGWLSQRYRVRHDCRIANSNDLAQVTSAGIFLVDFLVLRRHAALCSGEIPGLISGLYKVCLGFQLAYLTDRFSAETPAALPDAAGFLKYLEDDELLIGEAEVCSGSPAMITQAYEAIVGGQSVAQGSLPPPCESLEIDWERFDEFTEYASAIWRDVAIYAMRMPEFLPALSDPQLPQEVQKRLNTLLQCRGTELLEGQAGLVIEIARAVHAALPPEPRLASDPAAATVPGSLAPVVLAWLTDAAGTDVQAHQATVANALRAQLDPYDCFEATVLAGLNQHLRGLMHSLGLDPGAPVGAPALSCVCGRTLRDWTHRKENDELLEARTGDVGGSSPRAGRGDRRTTLDGYGAAGQSVDPDLP
jgi:hypothetical protein